MTLMPEEDRAAARLYEFPFNDPCERIQSRELLHLFACSHCYTFARPLGTFIVVEQGVCY